MVAGAITIAAGRHTVTADKPFSAVVFGSVGGGNGGDHCTYAFPAGLCTAEINPIVETTTVTSTTTTQAPAAVSAVYARCHLNTHTIFIYFNQLYTGILWSSHAFVTKFL